MGQCCAQRGFTRIRTIRAGFLKVVGLCLKMPVGLGKAAALARRALAASPLVSSRDVLCYCSIPTSEEADGNSKCSGQL